MHAAHMMPAASSSPASPSSSPTSQPPPMMMPANRPPKCRIANCELTFESYYKREIHERTHFGGEVPFPCPVNGCKKGYNVIRSLHSHIRARHPEKMELYGVPPISKAGITPDASANTNAPSLINPRAALHVSQHLRAAASSSASSLGSSTLAHSSSAFVSARNSPDRSRSPPRRGSSASSSSYGRSSPSASPPPDAARSLAALRDAGRRSASSSPSGAGANPHHVGVPFAALSAHLLSAAAAAASASSPSAAASVGQKRVSLSNILDPSLPLRDSKRARLSPRSSSMSTSSHRPSLGAHSSPSSSAAAVVDSKPFEARYARFGTASGGSSSPPPLVSSTNSSSRPSMSPERECESHSMVLRKHVGSIQRTRHIFPKISPPADTLAPTPPHMAVKKDSPILSPHLAINAVQPPRHVDDMSHFKLVQDLDAHQKMSHLSEILRRSKISDSTNDRDRDGDVSMGTERERDSKRGVRSLDLSRVAPPPEEDDEVVAEHPSQVASFVLRAADAVCLRRASPSAGAGTGANKESAATRSNTSTPPSPSHAELVRNYARLQQHNDFLKVKLAQKTALLEEAERVINALMMVSS